MYLARAKHQIHILLSPKLTGPLSFLSSTHRWRFPPYNPPCIIPYSWQGPISLGLNNFSTQCDQYEEVNEQFYYSSNGNYGGNNGMSQPNLGSNYTGDFRTRPLGNYAGNAPSFSSQQNQNGFYNSSFGNPNAEVMSNSNPSEETLEAAEGDQLRGTIQELDDLCKDGKLKEALKVLGLLEEQRIPVDLPRYLMLMKACSEDKALEEARAVHSHLARSTPNIDTRTYNVIIEMYSQCGSIDDAFEIFNKMPQRNLTSWDIMITWLAKNGRGEDALELFSQFKERGLKPDSQMFFGLFLGCGVVGDVAEGMLHFDSMSKDYGIVPSMEHYVSAVAMMGSAGYLDEALEFIEKMPIEPSVEVWETLMNLCRAQGNMELGDRCAEIVEHLDPARLDEQSKAGLIPVKASDIEKEKEKKKLAAKNLLEVRSKVHEYRAGDRSHPDHEKIYALLRGMRQQMKEAGYVPETKFVLHDIDQEGKEEALMAHSERLAVAQGLMSSPVRSPIRVIKNLRVCGDCHNALKIICDLVGRELIMRDAKRFHHFKDGVCSCKDYW